MRRAGPHPQEFGLRPTERHRQQGPIQQQADHHNNDCEDSLLPELLDGDPEDITEQNGRERTEVGVHLRDDGHAEGQHADEQESDRGVLTQLAAPRDGFDQQDHDEGGHRCSEERIYPQNNGGRYARNNPMHEGIAEEAHSL